MWNETPIDSSSPKTNQSAYLNYFQKAGFVFGIFGAVLAFVFAIAHLLFWTFTDFYVGLFMFIGFLGQCLLYLSALHALRRPDSTTWPRHRTYPSGALWPVGKPTGLTSRSNVDLFRSKLILLQSISMPSTSQLQKKSQRPCVRFQSRASRS